MALELQLNGIEINDFRHRARSRHFYAIDDDLPERGDIATWIDGTDDWAVDIVRRQPNRYGNAQWNECVIESRRPGFDWTWVGLTPIASRGVYRLLQSTDYINGEYRFGYWTYFSNWDGAMAWGEADGNTLVGPLRTWEVEWVDTVSRQHWHMKRNGSWPTGMNPPAGRTVVNRYLCRAIEIRDEPYMDPHGNQETYYRHFATFWEAPVIASTQMLWRHPSW